MTWQWCSQEYGFSIIEWIEKNKGTAGLARGMKYEKSRERKHLQIPSATLLKSKDVELLSTLDADFHMFPDRDEPGERLFMKLQEVLPRLVHHQLPIGCKDFSEFYLQWKK